MSAYPILKHLHMAAAYLTVILFVLRLLFDAVGWPKWRQGPLRWIPHVNDTVLLVAAISLLFVTPWMPFVHGWLTAKIFLLVGYIFAGVYALKPTLSVPVRVGATIVALAQVFAIFYLAINKPILF
ncbi:MAG TPA: SirB2 family protein [Marinobacter sp.]|nr:SirB2 family protein [Marinobacter sp.]